MIRLVLALALLAAPLETASAHASLLSSTPANGSHLSKAPNLVRFVFSEPIVASLSHVMLAGADGRQSKLDVAGDPHEVRAIESMLPHLGNGVYRVKWHIISADGHPVSGMIVFAIGDSAGTIDTLTHHGGQMEMSDDEPMLAGAAFVPAILRGLALSALLSLTGLLGFGAYGPRTTPQQMRLCAWLSVIATVLLTVHLIVWLIHVSPENKLEQSIVQAALSREVGLNELLRLVLTALSAWAILLARRLRIAFAFALAAVIAGGLIGHPAAIEPLIAIPMKSLHLVGVALWLGGLIALATSDSSAADTAMHASTVSSIATIAIVIVGLTGIVQSFLFLSSWTEIFSSAYGLTLIAKALGLLLLTAFGAYHRYSLLPKLDDSGIAGLRRSVRREIAVMICVVMVGGFLAYVPTPHMT